MSKLTIGSSQISVRQRGDGDPVVMLHCSASCGRHWDPVADSLSAATALGPLRLIVPDLFGYGSSDSWADRGPLTLGKEAEIPAGLASQISQPVHLVGHSYGGAVALATALAYPQIVKTLTLIEPVSFHLLIDGDSRDRALLREIRAVAIAVRCGVLLDDPEPGMQRFIDFWNGRGSWARLPEPVRRTLRDAAPQVARNFWSVTGCPIRLTDIARVQAPTRLIVGGRTKPVTRRVADLLERHLPRVTRSGIPDAGHMSPSTHPGAVSTAIAAHLAMTQSTARSTAA